MKYKYQKGQTLLMLLVFAIIGIMVTSAAAVMMLVNSSNTQKTQSGTVALQIAESGMENALLRLLRNPNYSSETLSVGDGEAIITVTGSNPYNITSIGTVGNFSRKIQVVVDYNIKMTISSWKEVF